MNKIQQVFDAIMRVLDIKGSSILCARGEKGFLGHQILCYIVRNDYGDLNNELAHFLHKRNCSCMLMAHRLKQKLFGDENALSVMNKVRSELNLAAIDLDKLAEIKRKPKKIISTKNHLASRPIAKRLFNIEYTNSDEIRLERAMQESIEFFKDYGKGRKPKYVGEI